MKKAELKEGQEYAVGSTSRYDQWDLAHVKVLDPNGEQPRSNGTVKKFILVEFVEDSATWGFRGRAGERRHLDSARGFHRPWSEYAESKRVHNEQKAEQRAEQKRIEELADNAIVRLRDLGFDADRSYGASLYWTSNRHFSVTADDMVKLLALIP